MKTMIGCVKKGLIVLPLLFTLLSCAHTDPPKTEASHSQASVSANASFTPLAARFIETRQHSDESASMRDWFFSRSETRIETAQEDYTEIWGKDERQEITLKRVFHGDRKVIEYTPGQLRAERRLKEWTRLAQMLDGRLLERLRQKGKTTILNQPALRYVGRVGEERIEIIWLPLQAIPAKLIRIQGEDIYTLELKELYQTPESSWPTADPKQIDAYEWIDGADLGDREYDPFVRKVLGMDAGRPGGHVH